MTRPSRRLVALHEAAHAVAHHFYPLAGTTRSVTIRGAALAAANAGRAPVNRALGQIYFARTLPLARGGVVVDREALGHELVALLAGHAAEWIASGARPDPAETPRQRARSQRMAAAADGCDDHSRALELCYAAHPRDIRAAVASIPEADRAGLTEAAMRELCGPAVEAHTAQVLEAFEAARAEAHEFVAKKWPHVTAVADRLLSRGTLTGDEVRELIEAVEERLRSGPPRFDFAEPPRERAKRRERNG